MESSKSKVADELDALRNRGLAKSHRDKYRDSSGTILTPEQVETYLAQIRAREKKRATLTPPTNLTSADLNDWYNQQRKLELKERKKRKEAEQLLHKYRSTLEYDEKQVKGVEGSEGKDVRSLEFTLSDGGFHNVAEEISKFDKNVPEERVREYNGKIWTPPPKNAANDLEKEVTSTTEDESLGEVLVQTEEYIIKQQVLELHKQRHANIELGGLQDSNMVVTTDDSENNDEDKESATGKEESISEPCTVIAETDTDGKTWNDIVENDTKETNSTGDELDESILLEKPFENSLEKDDSMESPFEALSIEEEEESSPLPVEEQEEKETISMVMEEVPVETLNIIEEDPQNVIAEDDKDGFDIRALKNIETTPISKQLEEIAINDSFEQSQAPSVGEETILHDLEVALDIGMGPGDNAKADNSVSTPVVDTLEKEQHIDKNESIEQEDGIKKEPEDETMSVALDKKESLKDESKNNIMMTKNDDVTKEKSYPETANNSNGGEGERDESDSGKNVYRNWVCSDPGSKYIPEDNRYHLYVSYACPWAHRTTMVRALKGLEDVIGITYVHPTWQYTNPDQDEHRGWVFGSTEEKTFTNTSGVGSFPSSWGEVDPIMNARSIREIYEKVNDTIGKFTVPILWDKSLNTIVSNESAEIIRMLNFEFNDLAKNPELNLYSEELEDEIDEVNSWVYPTINNGVYRCGLASNQEMYDLAIDQLTESFDRVDGILQKQSFLLGDSITEADVRLFVTLLRFDEVYNVYFKTNTRSVSSCKSILTYVKRIYNMKGVKETCRMDMIKAHYFTSHVELNKYSIIPRGDDFMKLLNSK